MEKTQSGGGWARTEETNSSFQKIHAHTVVPVHTLHAMLHVEWSWGGSDFGLKLCTGR